MTDHDPFTAEHLSPAEAQAVAASDLRGAIGWGVLGVAVLAGSLTMDRLEKQDINPYTVPGLLPGLLGIVMTLLGVLLALRSWRRGGATRGGARLRVDSAVVRRLALVIALILGYAVVLVGHGMPFWLASALYIAASIVTLQRPQRIAAGRTLGWRDVVFAVAVGLGSGLGITFVFQDLFLVRLP
ncbi:MAG: tripartite tricarboxylate transporter TctB family protein [Pseudomonadota bacterium]|nr:tripartite tricarboxylate transporter TctB family protein [Pseudomonadota bacterium]